MNLPRVNLSFWQSVKIIWSFARRRAAGRKAHQATLLSRKAANSKTVSSGDPLGCMATIGMIILGCVLHGIFGSLVASTATVAVRVDTERGGKIAVSPSVYKDLQTVVAPKGTKESDWARDHYLELAADRTFNEKYGYRKKADPGYIAHFARQFDTLGMAGFVEVDSRGFEGRNVQTWPRLALGVVAFGVLIWLAMLTCQGEGVDFDVQRRRHPVWEWLLSHPVRPAAILIAETLSPFVANPMYYTAPVFWYFLLSGSLGAGQAMLGAVLVGWPVAVAASSLNKSLEAAAMLRLGVRNRGAMLGIMSWIGFAGMFLPMFLMGADGLKLWIVRTGMLVFDHIPAWPVQALLGGMGKSVALSTSAGLLFAVGLLLLSGVIAKWAMARGLDPGNATTDVPDTRGKLGSVINRYDPVFWKELLWFRRDRGAVIQAILIPLTLASFQAFNFRAMAGSALEHWFAFCGVAIICGTYFLMVLGPRSLASEGGALWIPMTWPRGLEDLLRAKARIWHTVASVIVGALFAIALWLFPAEWWKILLVAVGWALFGRSMAMRAVTLVSPMSDSGESRPPSAGSRYAALVGMFSFSGGVLAQNWHLAVIGVVFSGLVAAACWQNLRARLPFLFDPWSEVLPQAPTLMHSMFAVAILSEVAGIGVALGRAFGGGSQAFLVPLAYGIIGGIAWLVMRGFLEGRGVADREIWNWLPLTATSKPRAVALGVSAGIGLGVVALCYVFVLAKLPTSAGWLHAGEAPSNAEKIGIFVLAVGLAPIVEEYFFRGLLFRALDREWGGTRALIGSAAYFAIYHPPISWLPVFALGVLNAWLFRRTRMLLPSVCAHMAYNAVVWMQ